MERIDQILRALLHRALGAHERQAAPNLADVEIETAQAAEPRVWVVFSNGYRSSVPLPQQDCWAFCRLHGIRDLETLRRALFRQAHHIYASMVRDQVQMRERERLTWVAEQVRRLTERLRPRREPPRFGRHHYRFNFDDCSLEAHERGLRLLKQNLTQAQRQQLERHAYFEVVGGKSGKRYRIRHGRSMNIDQLDKNGRRVCGWCFFPVGGLVAGDVMLAQKVALELFEQDALRIANKMW